MMGRSPRVVCTLTHPDTVGYVFATSSEGTHALNSLRGVPRGSDWQPISVEISMEDEEGRRLEDLDVLYAGGHLVVRERVHDQLSPLLAPYGQLLPLAQQGREALWVFNATVVVDALNRAATDHVVGPDGEFLPTGSLAFRSEALPADGAFRASELLQGVDVFYLEGLVDRLSQLGLPGLDFSVMWAG